MFNVSLQIYKDVQSDSLDWLCTCCLKTYCSWDQEFILLGLAINYLVLWDETKTALSDIKSVLDIHVVRRGGPHTLCELSTMLNTSQHRVSCHWSSRGLFVWIKYFLNSLTVLSSVVSLLIVNEFSAWARREQTSAVTWGLNWWSSTERPDKTIQPSDSNIFLLTRNPVEVENTILDT